MMYLGSTQASSNNNQIAYVYRTNSDVTNNTATPNAERRIVGLFREGQSGNNTTIWKRGASDRLDLQNAAVSGNNINGALGTGMFSNYSFQMGGDSYGVVYIKNTITSRVAIDTALKAYSNNRTYDIRLLRILLTMMVLSNDLGLKIAITDTQIRNPTAMDAATQHSLQQAQIAAKGVF